VSTRFGIDTCPSKAMVMPRRNSPLHSAILAAALRPMPARVSREKCRTTVFNSDLEIQKQMADCLVRAGGAATRLRRHSQIETRRLIRRAKNRHAVAVTRWH
jgi:hypothetical protein